MAKILLSTVSGVPNTEKLPCFYEGFVEALLREGNDVMLMITNNFLESCWHNNRTLSVINKRQLNREIEQFAPDLVITFNNSLYEKVPDLVSCPIAIWGSDSPAIFSDKDEIRKNVGRYDFICPTKDFYPIAKEYFDVASDRLHTVYFATDFVAEDLEQDKNITFIGTNFSHTGSLKRFLHENLGRDVKTRDNFLKFMESYKGDVLASPETHLKALGIELDLDAISHTDLLNLISSNFRVQTLQQIADLGLRLYGSRSWYEALDFSLDLALCFIDQEVSSVQDNQDIYNQSKLAINITHAQAKSGFGWRVRDIMATNACLVSDYREELVTQFGAYVKIPVYHTPYEARELCQKLLKDESWRKEIVQGSQLAIEKEHRFKHRLIDLENIFGIKLFDNKKGTLTQLRAENFMPEMEQLRRQNALLQQKLLLLEKYSQHDAINGIYKFCNKIFPRVIKTKVKQWLV